MQASQYVITICKIAENCFKSHINKYCSIKGNITARSNVLIQKTMMQVLREIANIFSNHIYDDNPLSNHFLVLTKLIITIFIKLRIHHEVSKIDHSKERIRSVLTKTILFKNQ